MTLATSPSPSLTALPGVPTVAAPDAVDAPGGVRAPGDPDATDPTETDFAATVDQHENALLRYAHHLLAPAGHRPPPPAHADAQDAVQDALLRLHREWARLGTAAIAHPRAWLLRVTHNLAMDQLRRRRTRRRHTQRLQDAAAADRGRGRRPTMTLAAMEQGETVATALRLLEALPADQQQVLRLRMGQDLNLRQIGEVLGLNHSKVHRLLQRGLETLAKQLKQAEVI